MVFMETEKRRSFVINFLYFLILIGGSILIFKYVFPVLSPFIIAFAISYMLRRPIRRICRKFNLSHKPTAIAVASLFYIVLGVVIAIISLRIFYSVGSGADALLHLYAVHIEPAISEIFANIENTTYAMDPKLFSLIITFEGEITNSIAEMVSNISISIMGFVSNTASSLPGTFIKIVFMVISTFFISADYQIITGFCLDQLTGKARELFLHIKEYVIGTLFVCIRSYAVIMFITFVELSVAFTIIKMQHAIPIAALIAIFDILPVLGTGGIMIPWGIFTLLRGYYLLGLELLLIYIIVTVIRNIIEPKIVGGKLGLHPVVTLASMTLGAKLAGVVGLFGLPILLSLLMHLNNEGHIRLFNTDKVTVRSDHTEEKTETTI